MAQEGKYLYCIIAESHDRQFGPIGIGGRGDPVGTITYQDLGCVISDTPMTQYVISREHLTAHERVIEEVMSNGYTVLPVRFCTIATSAEEIRTLLRKRYAEFRGKLRELDGKIELGLRVFWNNMATIFGEIAQEQEAIKDLKRKAERAKAAISRQERIEIGEAVKAALDAKRSHEAEAIVESLRPHCLESRMNPVVGDEMVVNAAFLLDRSREPLFDDAVETLMKQDQERIKLNYIGPAPPFNFVEIVVPWTS